MDETHAIGLYHLLATGGGGLLGTLALVWRMWVVPAQAREVELQVRLAKMETRLDSGDKKFDEMSADIKDIKDTIHRLEKAFAAVAPALARES